MRAVACVVALAALTGCSLFTVHGPRSAVDMNGCTEKSSAPIADAIVAVAGVGVGSVLILDTGGDSRSTADAKTDLGVVLGVIGAVFAVAAGRGFYEVSRCQDARVATTPILE